MRTILPIVIVSLVILICFSDVSPTASASDSPCVSRQFLINGKLDEAICFRSEAIQEGTDWIASHAMPTYTAQSGQTIQQSVPATETKGQRDKHTKKEVRIWRQYCRCSPANR
jgi:hypothetical protein